MFGTTEVFANSANYGGGLMVQESTSTGGVIDSNTAGNAGAGVYLFDDGTVIDATITNNTAPNEGGGVLVSFRGRVVGGLVSANQGQHGGGFSVNGDLIVEGTEISDNQAMSDGGGIQLVDDGPAEHGQPRRTLTMP